jgi:hypothetical protein
MLWHYPQNAEIKKASLRQCAWAGRVHHHDEEIMTVDANITDGMMRNSLRAPVDTMLGSDSFSWVA